MFCYLSHYRWNTPTRDEAEGFWTPPHAPALHSCIDLRTLPQRALKATQAGFGIFCYDSVVADPSLILLGQHDKRLSVEAHNILGLNLGIAIPRLALQDYLFRLLTLDNNASKICPNLMPRIKDRKILLKVGDIEIQQEVDTLHWPKVQGRIFQMYRDAKTFGRPSTHRKILSLLEEKYQRPYTDFIPSDLPDVKPLPHDTTITEDWNCANAGSLTCDLSWVDTNFSIVSNEAAASDSSTNSHARAETDLSGDDHYSEVDVVFARTSSAQSGVFVRMDTVSISSPTCYAFTTRRSTTDTHQLWSVSSGTYTQIGSSVNDGSAPVATWRGRLEVDGSNLDSFFDSVAKNSETDSGITGNLRCGIVQKGSRDSDYDNFEAGDLSAGGATDEAGIMMGQFA